MSPNWTTHKPNLTLLKPHFITGLKLQAYQFIACIFVAENMRLKGSTIPIERGPLPVPRTHLSKIATEKQTNLS